MSGPLPSQSEYGDRPAGLQVSALRRFGTLIRPACFCVQDMRRRLRSTGESLDCKPLFSHIEGLAP